MFHPQRQSAFKGPGLMGGPACAVHVLLVCSPSVVYHQFVSCCVCVCMYVCVCVWLRESAVCGQSCPSLQAESRVRRWSLLSASWWLSRSLRCGLEVQVWVALLRLLPYWPLRVNPPLSAGDTASLCGGRTHHWCFVSLFWLPACPPPPPLPPAAASFLSGSNSLQFLKYASL